MDNRLFYVYPYSCEEAKRLGQLDWWRESHKENIACRHAIEEAIRRDFDGMHLNTDSAKSVIEEYGFQRVRWVLANTIQQKEWDGRFSHDNKEWAKQTDIPTDENSINRNLDFVADSHPAVLDGFINQYRRAYQALELFGQTHCEPESEDLDYEGKVLVLSPGSLKEKYWSQQNQLWLATGGFGCSPTSYGRAVYATCLGDGEELFWNRHDFVGVLKEEYMPEWANKKRMELQGQFAVDIQNTGELKME